MSLDACRRGAERWRSRLVLGELRLDRGSVRDLPAEVVVGVRPEHTRLWDGDAGLLGPIEGRVEYASRSVARR